MSPSLAHPESKRRRRGAVFASGEVWCLRSAAPSRRVGRQRANATERGVTLIEVLVVVGIIALLAAGTVMSFGAIKAARLRGSASMVAGAIRVAYNHASATSRPVRLVFDFDSRSVSLEEGSGPMLIRHGETTGGAEAATDPEREALEAAEEILDGPKAPRSSFKPATAMGFNEKNKGKELESGVRFRQIEVEHEDDPVRSERAYLYFWPGGQTERAAIQVQLGLDDEDAEDDDILTLTVAPLTGKVVVERGPVEMPRPSTDDEASERDDTGF